jgi:DtxR family Mn-dependent transcriptional regulator
LQDYLKAIHRLTEGADGGRATTTGIARELGVSAPSVSAMLDRMKAGGLVDYVHYAGATLTDEGQREALRVIRRHRLIELFLVRHLGLGWDEVHEEAERLEHVVSDRLEQAIDRLMNFPERDPHGDPIPAVDGSVALRSFRTLWGAAVGQSVRVDRVSDTDTGMLRHLQKAGLVPGATLTVLARDAGGVMEVRVGAVDRRTIGQGAAEKVYLDG